jgi:hypothetical protein
MITDKCTQMLSPLTIYQKIAANLETVITGQAGAIRKLLAAFACGGMCY